MAVITWEDTNDWKRLGQRIAQARVARGWSQDQAATAADIGVTTWREIEGGKQTVVRMLTLAAISLALEWNADGAVRILRGEEPVSEPPADPRLDQIEADLRDVREMVLAVATATQLIQGLLERIAGSEEAAT